MKKTLFWIAITVVPLIAGSIIYLAFRPTAIVSKAIYGLFDINPAYIETPDNLFWRFIKYYLGDFLWAFSLTALVKLILGKGKPQSIVALSIGISVGFLVELFQKYGLIPGTFDFFDLLVETLGAILSLIITIIHSRRNENEKQTD